MNLKMNPLLADALHERFHYADAEVSSAIDDAKALFDMLGQHLSLFDAELQNGRTLGECLSIDPSLLSRRAELVMALLSQKSLHAALIIGMYGSIVAPHDSRYSFVAASCLQKLGDPAEAGRLFYALLQSHPNHIGASFRFAQCCAASGDKDAATRMFAWTVELCRARNQYPDVQQCAQKEWDALAVL